ncbi:MAG: putative porin [Bacteroidales bacterium]|nr:putative porin [Bacteroidales bacterium]
MELFKLVWRNLLLSYTLILLSQEKTDSTFFSSHEKKDDGLFIQTYYIKHWLNQWLDTNLEFYHRIGPAESMYQYLYFADVVERMPKKFDSFLQNFEHFVCLDTSFSFLFKPKHEPYSITSYSQGSKREQQFSFWFYFPWGKQVDVLLNYHLVGSAGWYKNQKISLSNFFSKINFHSKNYRFRTLFLLQDNYFRFQENGGIKYAEDFLDTSIYDRALCQILLSKASRHVRFTRFSWNSSYAIIQKPFLEIRLFPLNIELEKKYNRFKDEFPGSGYYQNIYLDSSITLDSLHVLTYRVATALNGKLKNIFFQLSMWQEWNRFSSMFNFDTMSTMSYFKWNWTSRNEKLLWVGKTSKGIVGANRSLLEIQHRLMIKVLSSGKLYLTQEIYSFHPSLLYERYRGNHLQYDHSLSDVVVLLHRVGLKSKFMTLEVYGADVRNMPVFYQNMFTSLGQIGVGGVSCYFNANFKNFFILNRMILQRSTSELLSLPLFGIRGEIFYRTWFFQRKLLGEVGMKYFYNSSYFADAYYPYLGIFYPQQDIQTDGFWYPTFFIRSQIKRAVFFVEIYNFAAGLFPVRYWQVPAYPLPDRGVRWGISWIFFN